MIQSNPIWQISEAEVAELARERQRLEVALRQEPPLRLDGLPRTRRLRGSDATKLDIVNRSEVVGDCWIWKQSKKKAEYGRLSVNKRYYDAHCVSLTLWKGDRPEGHEGCHKCDNPPCVNPAHLFWGTRKDNVLDCIQKGRFNRPTGERWHSKHPKRSPRTHCSSGHLLAGENVYEHDGRRYCIQCRRIIDAARKLRRRSP